MKIKINSTLVLSEFHIYVIAIFLQRVISTHVSSKMDHFAPLCEYIFMRS